MDRQSHDESINQTISPHGRLDPVIGPGIKCYAALTECEAVVRAHYDDEGKNISRNIFFVGHRQILNIFPPHTQTNGILISPHMT